MKKPRLDRRGIARTAVTIVNDGGFDALSLSAVAERLGVGPSALYSHVDGLNGLRRLVAMHAMNNLVSQVREAAIGVSGPAAVRSVSDAYRNFALTYPGQFQFTVMAPRTEDPELANANNELLNVFTLVFRGTGLDRRRSTQAARSARSAIHGFAALEAATGSPAHESHYRELLEMMTSRVSAAAPAPSAPGDNP